MPKRPMTGAMTGEWPFPVDSGLITTAPKIFHLTANEQERVNLARRAGVLSITTLEARITLQKLRGGVIHAMGVLSAEFTQNCVVTLIPVTQYIEESFEGWYGGEDAAVSFARAKSLKEAKKPNVEMEVLEESVDPEPIINGIIDLGELAAQHFCLSVPPYPRAAEASFAQSVDDVSQARQDSAGHRKNPFEALKDWKEKR